MPLTKIVANKAMMYVNAIPKWVKHTPTIKKKKAYDTEPKVTPRNRFDAAFAPCWECVKAANTTPKIGKVEINPLSCGPSMLAKVVRSATKVVATIIRAGKSHLG
jgi:hypothetical protein